MKDEYFLMLKSAIHKEDRRKTIRHLITKKHVHQKKYKGKEKIYNHNETYKLFSKNILWSAEKIRASWMMLITWM